MKKLHLIRQNAPSTLHRSISAMLTPFLFVFFLLGFVNVGFGQQADCPALVNGCDEIERFAFFDIGTFIGSPSCQVRFSYKERLCINGQIEVYGVETDPSKWQWSSKACLDAYNNHVKSVATQGNTAINNFILKQEIALTDAGLRFSLRIFFDENPHLVCPQSSIVGKSFYKTCSVSCMHWVEKLLVPIEGPATSTAFFLEIKTIPCGTTCCTAEQRFCKNAATGLSEPISPKTFTSNNIAGCDKNTPVKGCEPKWGYFGKTSCIIACDFVPKGLANGKVEEDDIASIDITDNTIKASILNNSTTKTIVVNFMNDFTGIVTLYDINGRQIFNADVNTNNGGLFYIETGGFSQGMYLLNLQNSNNNIVTEKIIIK
jgi:hypothetical protein